MSEGRRSQTEALLLDYWYVLKKRKIVVFAFTGFLLLTVDQLGGGQPLELILEFIPVGNLGNLEFPGGKFQHSQPVTPIVVMDARKVIAEVILQQVNVINGSGTDDLRDFPLNDFPRLDLPDLVGNGDAFSRLDQLADI